MPYYSRIFISLVCIILLNEGCFEKKTSNAEKAYRYWTGEKPPENVKVLNGQYWASAHWSKEYILYLEMIAPADWINGLKDENNLKAFKGTDTAPGDDQPAWFKPGSWYKVYSPNGNNSSIKLYEDSSSGHIFFTDTEL